MKNLILSIMFVLSCVFVTAQDAEYKYVVAGSSNFSYISSDAVSGGTVGVTAMYIISDKLQAGAAIGLGFGDLDSDAAVRAAARYYVKDDIFAYADMALTDAAGEGFRVGAGKTYSLSDRIELNPTVRYDLDAETLDLVVGFAFKF